MGSTAYFLGLETALYQWARNRRQCPLLCVPRPFTDFDRYLVLAIGTIEYNPGICIRCIAAWPQPFRSHCQPKPTYGLAFCYIFDLLWYCMSSVPYYLTQDYNQISLTSILWVSSHYKTPPPASNSSIFFTLPTTYIPIILHLSLLRHHAVDVQQRSRLF